MTKETRHSEEEKLNVVERKLKIWSLVSVAMLSTLIIDLVGGVATMSYIATDPKLEAIAPVLLPGWCVSLLTLFGGLGGAGYKIMQIQNERQGLKNKE